MAIGCRCVGLLAALALGLVSASAADIKLDSGGVYNFNTARLEGKIEKGDYEKLLSIARQIGADFNPHFKAILHLYSPGGDVTEAMRMGRLVRALRWTTTVPDTNGKKREYADSSKVKKIDPDNFMCASACFFIFVAGAQRSTKQYGYVAPLILGIHRPYLSDADLKSISSTDAMASANSTRTVVESYLKEMSVPAKYADLMFSVPKDQIQWLNPSDVNADLVGFIPELKDWIDARCNKFTNIEKALRETLESRIKSAGSLSQEDSDMLDMIHDREIKQFDCERGLMSELNQQAFKDVFKPK